MFFGRGGVLLLMLSSQVERIETGESSAARYCTIAQGGPMKVAVSDLKLAESLLSLTPESVPSFADIVLIETQDDAAFFANEQDEDGVLRDGSKANRRRIGRPFAIVRKSIERKRVDGSVSIARPSREPKWHPSQIYLCKMAEPRPITRRQNSQRSNSK